MRIIHKIKALTAALTLFVPLTFSGAAPAFADSCASGDHILEVTTDKTMCLTIDELKELPTSEIRTSTIWTDGEHLFTGVLLSDLLAHVGAEGSGIQATAINDYAITIPGEDAIDGGPIVAYEMDNAEMSRRDKGPLWIVYPFDSAAKYRTETIYSRSIWQLNRIQVTE